MLGSSRTVLSAAAFVVLLPFVFASAATPPQGSPVPGACANPKGLGTARSVEVGGAVRLGLKTYPQTLALADHEVVLTFDDGPWPKTTASILSTLAADCVHATFFLIGRNATATPALAKREIAEGHSVGHHTWSHPAVTLRGLNNAAARADIDRGIADDDMAAYGASSSAPRVPFFRFPGFADTPALLDHLAERRIAVFGADLWASDWVPMTPEAELALLMGRLDRVGRGIILLHDTKAQTAAMLPALVAALKAGGYHVVHLVPGSGATPTRPAPQGWTSQTERTIEHRWPKLPKGAELAPVARPAEPRPQLNSEP